MMSSIELSTEDVARIAATLANGGVQPYSGDRIFTAANVRSCLALMATCGMYQYSGEWSFSVGLPAKSAVNGTIMVVIPNVMVRYHLRLPRLRASRHRRLRGAADQRTHAPRDAAAAAAAGRMCPLAAGRHAQQLGAWHRHFQTSGPGVRTAGAGGRGPFAGIGSSHVRRSSARVGVSDLAQQTGGKKNARQQTGFVAELAQNALCQAAAIGDVSEIHRLVAVGADVNLGDYDGRTALHLAVTERHRAAVQVLLQEGAVIECRDRWGLTPADYAASIGATDLVHLLLSDHRR